jgi:hypothetical protein
LGRAATFPDILPVAWGGTPPVFLQKSAQAPENAVDTLRSRNKEWQKSATERSMCICFLSTSKPQSQHPVTNRSSETQNGKASYSLARAVWSKPANFTCEYTLFSIFVKKKKGLVLGGGVGFAAQLFAALEWAPALFPSQQLFKLAFVEDGDA